MGNNKDVPRISGNGLKTVARLAIRYRRYRC